MYTLKEVLKKRGKASSGTIQNTSLIDKHYSVADLVKLNDLTLKWSSKEIKFLKTDERKLYSEFMELQSDYFAFLDTLETNVLENDIENDISTQQFGVNGSVINYYDGFSRTQGHAGWIQIYNADAYIAFSAEL